VTLLLVIAINLAIGMLPHVDNFAHIGGFLTGFLLGFVLLRLTIGMAMVFRGVNGNEHCQWSHYLSCVPTAKWSCGK
jgi:predicted GNAT superfamily acetyltransferase